MFYLKQEPKKSTVLILVKFCIIVCGFIFKKSHLHVIHCTNYYFWKMVYFLNCQVILSSDIVWENAASSNSDKWNWKKEALLRNTYLNTLLSWNNNYNNCLCLIFIQFRKKSQFTLRYNAFISIFESVLNLSKNQRKIYTLYF